MKPWLAILTTLGLLVGCSLLLAFTGISLFLPLVVGTSVWAGVDSGRLGLRRFQSGISYGPVGLGIVCCLLWIVGFPWYLAMRHKILTGKARLRPEFESGNSEGDPTNPKGLVQPWQGKRL